MAWLQRGVDAFRGRGEAAATVPPMDGALHPNILLQTAREVLRIEAPDNLVVSGGSVLFSSGCGVFMLDAAAGTARELRRFDRVITCLAATDGLLAAGLDDGRLHFCRPDLATSVVTTLDGERPACPTAMAFRDASSLIVCHGSSRNSPGEWQRDLMQRQSAGSVWEVSVADGSARVLAGGLAFPNGAILSEGEVIVSESWRHRLVRLTGAGAVPILADLPGYPARIAPSAQGDYWLCVFAPRSQLIEFVLRETGYRERMMRELDPDHWIAPTLSPPKSFLEPMQGGALRSHGILKPWAPTRSYGLLIRLNAQFRPVASYHSRADGTRHGITSCVEAGSQVLVASRGGDAILAIPIKSEPDDLA